MTKSLLPLFFIGAFILGISSCKYSNEYETINVKNKFSLTVPDWTKEEDKLAPNAPFQYANRFRNFYSVAFVAEKDKPFQLYVQTNLDSLKAYLKNPLLSDSAAVQPNGANGVRAEVFGKMNNENIYFSEEFINGKNSYYHISVWTRGEERKLHFKEDINRILNSFKEI